jgi:hypothetical protein
VRRPTVFTSLKIFIALGVSWTGEVIRLSILYKLIIIGTPCPDILPEFILGVSHSEMASLPASCGPTAKL